MDNLKDEYSAIIEEIDQNIIEFNKLEEKTERLREKYRKSPKDENILKEIKNHEKEYKTIYDKIQKLNIQAEKLKEKYNK